MSLPRLKCEYIHTYVLLITKSFCISIPISNGESLSGRSKMRSDGLFLRSCAVNFHTEIMDLGSAHSDPHPRLCWVRVESGLNFRPGDRVSDGDFW